MGRVTGALTRGERVDVEVDGERLAIASRREGRMRAHDGILKAIADREDEWLGLVAELVRRPSVNPPGDTRAAAAFVVDYLAKRGHPSEVVAPQQTMPNVLASLENGPGRHLILNGHLDTFPVGDPALWERDPFSGEVADGKIFGRGVSDMKAGVAASIAAFCLLAERREAWKGKVTLAAVADMKLRQRIAEILSDRVFPQRWDQFEQALQAGQQEEVLSQLTPSETFFLAAEFRRLYPAEAGAWGTAGQELEELSRQHPGEVSWERISQDFGVPHPMLAQTYARELLALKPLPTFLGYSSRLLAESWESNNLYWARLADEKGYPPALLHRLVPTLTRRMVEKIFATHLEDWPAVLRALRETGEEFRLGKILALPKVETASGL